MDFVVDLRRKSWGQWQASAIKSGTLDRAIDGPYADDKGIALAGLRRLIPDANFIAISETHNGD